MNGSLKNRIAEEWARLDPVDPLRRLLSDVIDVLAQPVQPPLPVQEPVAWAVYYKGGGSKSLHWPENHSPNGDATMFDAVPLVPQRPWVGLTDDDFDTDMFSITSLGACDAATIKSIAKDIEAKLKEKNT
jgi:hypothetical protein